MLPKPDSAMGLTAASLPPATMTSAAPSRIWSQAEAMAWPAEAQADVVQ